MASGRGKHLTILTAAVALVVLVAAGVAAAPRLREQWYLWKLESQDDGTAMQAANWLVENGSPESRFRAVLVLLPHAPKSLLDNNGPVYMRPTVRSSDVLFPK